MVEGYYIERFINICSTNSIILWNLTRKKSTVLYVNVGVSEYRDIVKIAKKTKCRVKIKKKKGIPFIFNKYKKRKFFALSVVVVIALLIILSNFIWNVEVIGLENIPRDEIIELVKNQGLKTGRLKGSIDIKEIINEIRLERNDIAWVGIEFKGTNAKIQIVEAKEKPEIINEEEYCDIKSMKTGMITKVKAQNGTPQVKEGDIVREGQVLVAGWIEGKYTPLRYVHSEGEVEAKVWYTHTEKVYYKQIEKVQTGQIENKYSIKINNFKINFYKMITKFKICDTIREEKALKMFNDFYLPIQLIKTTNYELIENEKNFSNEEAIEYGKQKAKQVLLDKIENKDSIANEVVNVYEKEQYVDVEFTLEVIESIGTKEKITL